MHRHNAKTAIWLTAVVLVCAGFIGLACYADKAEAHAVSAGFEPTDALLACIRSYEGAYTTDTGNGYYGAYQFDTRTWISAIGPIGNDHFRHWGSPRTAYAHQAHPMIQDEAARNTIRARGLQPWPTPNRRCPR